MSIMINLSKKDRDALIKLLQKGKDLPSTYRNILCGEEETQKE